MLANRLNRIRWRQFVPARVDRTPRRSVRHPLVDGIIYDSHIDIANFFNAHCANITSLVVLNQNETSNLDYLKDLVRSQLPLGASFIIPPITSVFVLDSLRHLPTGKAVGLDGLNGYFLKLSAPSIVYRVFSNNNF